MAKRSSPLRMLFGCALVLLAACTKQSDPGQSAEAYGSTDSDAPTSEQPVEQTAVPSDSPSGTTNAADLTESSESSADRPAIPNDGRAAIETPSSDQVEESPIAKVYLSEAHAARCLVKVGDSMPEISLPDLSGAVVKSPVLYGDVATVVVFFNASTPFAQMELADMTLDVSAPFSGGGVKVFAVAVQETAESARKQMQQAKATFPCLVDEKGEAFSQVGTNNLPRTFLLDSSGKILWFDIEYSSSTRRELLHAIPNLIRQHAASKNATAPGLVPKSG